LVIISVVFKEIICDYNRLKNLKYVSGILLCIAGNDMDSDANYRIRVRKGDFEVEVQGDDRVWVEGKFKELTTQKVAVSISKRVEVEGMPTTLGEFLDQKGNPSKHTDTIAVFAYWLFKVEKMESFNVKDVINCYDRTRKAKPSNPNQIVNQNVASHIFAEASGKKDDLKAWVITRTGEEYVEKMK